MHILKLYKILTIFICPPLLIIWLGCTYNNSGNNVTGNSANSLHALKHVTKPPSIYLDSIDVDFPVAVFFYPDSLQLQKLKNTLDSSIYKGIMHDYFYQMRYAHIVLKRDWPQLKIAESKYYRYIVFKKRTGADEAVDLNKINDVYGLLVSDGKNKSENIDLTNIETELSRYFNHNK